MELSSFPALNASLNAVSAFFLVTGYVLVRRKAVTGHKICMLAACTASVLFLACYLWYHAHAGSTAFQGTGPVRVFYFSVLISHTVLAAGLPFLVAGTLTFALKGRFEKHVRWARITFPVWLYVSVTGVLVYWMLYRMGYH